MLIRFLIMLFFNYYLTMKIKVFFKMLLYINVYYIFEKELRTTSLDQKNCADYKFFFSDRKCCLISIFGALKCFYTVYVFGVYSVGLLVLNYL